MRKPMVLARFVVHWERLQLRPRTATLAKGQRLRPMHPPPRLRQREDPPRRQGKAQPDHQSAQKQSKRIVSCNGSTKQTKSAAPADMNQNQGRFAFGLFGEKMKQGSLLPPEGQHLSVEKKNTVCHNHPGNQVSNSALPMPRSLEVSPRRSKFQIGLFAPFFNQS